MILFVSIKQVEADEIKIGWSNLSRPDGSSMAWLRVSEAAGLLSVQHVALQQSFTRILLSTQMIVALLRLSLQLDISLLVAFLSG